MIGRQIDAALDCHSVTLQLRNPRAGLVSGHRASALSSERAPDDRQVSMSHASRRPYPTRSPLIFSQSVGSFDNARLITS